MSDQERISHRALLQIFEALTVVDNYKVSVYIPCYNVENYIEKCLDGLMKQTLKPDEILIIDDGSKDRTVEIASGYPVTVVQHESNKGLSAARNTAVKTARNELVAAIDADCVPDSRWLEKLVKHLSDEKVAGVGGKLLESEAKTLPDRWRAFHIPQNYGDSMLINPEAIFGHNNIVRRSVIAEIGWYNEILRTNGEDGDISMRIKQKGYDIIYEPEATVCHLREDTLASLMDNYWRYWRFGTQTYLQTIDLRTVLYKMIRIHIISDFPKLVIKDLFHLHLDFLFIDFYSVFYVIYRDFRLYKNRRDIKSDLHRYNY